MLIFKFIITFRCVNPVFANEYFQPFSLVKGSLLASKNGKKNCFYPQYVTLTPLNPKSDQDLISPYSNTAESFINVIIRKEMIANPKKL